MLFREYRFHDIAEDDDRPLQIGLGIAVLLPARARQFGDRPTALQNHLSFAGLMNAVEDGEAPRLEVRSVDPLHATTVHGQPGPVKALPAFATQAATRNRTIRSVAIYAAFVLGVFSDAPVQAETLSGPARVIDGDTLAVAGQRIRLDGIDAPETRQTCGRDGSRWACGREATQAMRNLAGRNTVRCEVSRRDGYNRTVGSCFANGRDLQQQLVRMGLALAYRRYSTRYVPDEDAARKEGIGLWSGSFVEPWRWRAERKQRIRSTPRREAPRAPPSASRACLIKGNISSNGRIYHVPGGEYYDRTGIDEAGGERWFCSEAEARAAGWRPSRK